jgi:hypothetical protein
MDISSNIGARDKGILAFDGGIRRFVVCLQRHKPKNMQIYQLNAPIVCVLSWRWGVKMAGCDY